MNRHKKPSIIGPGASSIVLINLLLVYSRENPQEKLSDIHEIFSILLLLLLSVSTIWLWQKYLKEYVAFSIEDRLNDIGVKSEN